MHKYCTTILGPSRVIQIILFSALQWSWLFLPLQSSLSIKEKGNNLATKKLKKKPKILNNFYEYPVRIFKGGKTFKQKKR